MATLRTVIFASICLFCAFTQAAALRGPFVSGSRFELRLDGETNAVYLIEQSTNLVNWNVVARDDDFMESRSFAFTNNLPSAFFRARRTNEPLFQFAMAARRGIDFNGHNLRTDSFDSADAWFSDGYGHYTKLLASGERMEQLPAIIPSRTISALVTSLRAAELPRDRLVISRSGFKEVLATSHG